MEINYVILLVGAIIAMIVGFVWYGPLFGKKWMEIIGATVEDEATRKEMQKKAGPLYGVQFLLVLLQLYVLTHVVRWGEAGGIETALWIWLGFIMPTIAGAAMWNNNSGRVKRAQFLIQSGYQLVMFIIFGWLLSNWG